MYFNFVIKILCSIVAYHVILWLALLGEMVEQALEQVMAFCCRGKLLVLFMFIFVTNRDFARKS